jgi:putative ABC transport system substrate-binding protein
MNRREFIAGLGSTAAWPVVAWAQQPDRMRRIGVLMPWDEGDPLSKTVVAGLNQGLTKLGWSEGRNLSVDYRWAIVDVERGRAAAIDLLARTPDVILANATPAVQGLQSLAHAVPTVFTLVTEPAAQGFIESLARPGGNLIGFSYLPPTIGGKWLELLKEVALQIAHVAFLIYPSGSPYGGLVYGSIQVAAAKLGVKTTLAPICEPSEFERVLSIISREPGGGFIVNPEAFMANHRQEIIGLAAHFGLLAVYYRRIFATGGGLASYGLDDFEHFQQVATYLDRILRGEKPANLPVMQPTKFDLAINRKIAGALGLTIPQTLLATADELIE